MNNSLKFLAFGCCLIPALSFTPACDVEKPGADTVSHDITVMHVPAAGCPSGWSKVPDIFGYQGKQEPACIRDGSIGDSGGTDYLRPGESQFLFSIPLAPDTTHRHSTPGAI